MGDFRVREAQFGNPGSAQTAAGQAAGAGIKGVTVKKQTDPGETMVSRVNALGLPEEQVSTFDAIMQTNGAHTIRWVG